MSSFAICGAAFFLTIATTHIWVARRKGKEKDNLKRDKPTNANKQITDMEQLNLFEKESEGYKAFRRRNDAIRPSRNRKRVKEIGGLMVKLNPEVAKVPHRLSFSLKTTIMIPKNATKEEIEKIEAKYRGEDGKIIHDVAPEQSLLGG